MGGAPSVPARRKPSLNASSSDFQSKPEKSAALWVWPALLKTFWHILAMLAAMRQSGKASPGGFINFSLILRRLSPFMEVRFISPGWAAGNKRWAASSILVGYKLMPTKMRPLFLVATSYAASARSAIEAPRSFCNRSRTTCDLFRIVRRNSPAFAEV